VAFSPDGSVLTSTSADRTVILWDVHKHSPIGSPLISHNDQVLTAVFSPDGKLLASGGMDGAVMPRPRLKRDRFQSGGVLVG
jgi:WD40 repeat protein